MLHQQRHDEWVLVLLKQIAAAVVPHIDLVSLLVVMVDERG